MAVSTQRLLGIENLTMFNDIMGSGPSGLAGAMDASMAIASGACETALVYRTITREAGHTGALREGPTLAPGSMQFTAPYGYGGGIILAMAMRKRRRVAELGGDYEDYGHVALNARRWAALNPRAIFRDPITMDDYFSSRPVADPLLLFDCDYPVNAACAAILTTAERARDLRHPPVVVDAIAFGTGRRPDWIYGDDFLFGGTIPCSEALWRRTDLSVADVDVAELYDGFTHITISWIEALGLCGVGGRRRCAHRARRRVAAEHLRRPARGGKDARSRVPHRSRGAVARRMRRTSGSGRARGSRGERPRPTGRGHVAALGLLTS
jgi:acetyl-CoA acetyltransferase